MALDKNSMFSKLYKKLDEIDGAQIIVGVQGEEGINFHGQTISSSEEMQKIAWVHEFGCDIKVTPKMRAFLHRNGIHLRKDTTVIHIPERSFIRRAQSEGKASFNSLFNRLIAQLLKSDDMTVDEVLDILGKQAVIETVSNMGDGTEPVTSYTLEHRKENHDTTPLVDTGKLQNHITYRIIKKGASSSETTSSWG